MKCMKIKREQATTIALVALTFAFFMVFYTRIHPIVIFDTDCWHYAYYDRHPWPIWGNWNPTRVFPEIMMPLVTQFGAFVIYPLSGDFFVSLTIGYAIAVSAVIAALTLVVIRHFQRQGSGCFDTIVLALFFLINHFLVLRSAKSGNQYMFSTVNACTYFYYVIPNLMNCILVIWLMDDPSLHYFFANNHHIRKAACLLLGYFCMFSNLWSSIVTVSYGGIVLLSDLIGTLKERKHGRSVIDWLRKNAILFILLALWGLAQVFEYHGGRANSLKGNPLPARLMETLTMLEDVLKTVSLPFLITSAVLIVLGVCTILRKKNVASVRFHIISLASGAVIAAYLLLSCAIAGPGYISRADVIYGVFFFIMLVLMTALKDILRYLPWSKIMLPLVLIILLAECNTADKTFLEATISQTPPEVCYQVDNDILQQLRDGEAAGKAKIKLQIPLYSGDNWPLATYGKDFFPKLLYKSGVLSTRIRVKEMVPTEKKNEKFHIKVD